MIGLACAALLLLGSSGYWLFFSSINSAQKDVRIYVDNDDTADSVYVKIQNAVSPSQLLGLKLCGTVLGYKSNVIPGSYVVRQAQALFHSCVNCVVADRMLCAWLFR